MDDKYLTETILEDLDSITKYNGKVSTISDETDQSNRSITFCVDTAVCRTRVPGNHPAARGYREHWDLGAGVPYSTAGKSMTETAEGSDTAEPNGDVPLQDQTESGDGKKEAPPGPKEPKKKYGWVDVVKKPKREKLESKFVKHTGTLDNQPYNAKQLVDNLNKNKVLKQILIKEKVNAKAEVTVFSLQSQSALVQIERLPQGKDVDSVDICAQRLGRLFHDWVLFFRFRLCHAFFIVR